MQHFLSRLAPAAVLVLSLGGLSAQTSVTYTAGENKTGAIVLDAAGNPATLTVATGTATQSGNISESGGSFGFAKNGAGSLILTGANSYTGTTTILAGTLQAGTTGALGAGALLLGPSAALHLTGGTHSVSGLIYNPGSEVVVSGGAVLNSIANLFFNDEDDGGLERIVVTGAGSRLTAPNLISSGSSKIRLTDGGVLEMTAATSPTWGQLIIGGESGQSAAAAGILSLPVNDTTLFADLVFNHTATSADPYWFTSDGTAAGRGLSGFGNYEVLSGVTILKNKGGNTAGSLTVSGGEIRFLSTQGTGFIQLNLNGGTATFAAAPVRSDAGVMTFNGGTLHLTESLTLDGAIKIQGTGGTINVDAGKTLTFAIPADTLNEGGQPFHQSGSYTKDGGGTIFLPREYSYNGESIVSFTVRQGTVRTFDFVFDDMVIGKLAGDDGHFTTTSVNPTSPNRAGLPTSLGFTYANYWNPAYFPGDTQPAEYSAAGAGAGYAIPVVQSRSLTVGAQAGSAGTITLSEGTTGGWYVHDGAAVIGGAGTGNVTLINHFLYNNGHDIVVGQSAGGVGTITVSGSNAQLNAGVDLVPLDVFGSTSLGSGYPGTPMDHGVGNIYIGQGGTGHVTVTNNARILAGQTFIGAGSDLTLGSGGSIIGGFTAHNGSTVHALDGAAFAYTLGATTEANAFEAGSTFTIDFGAQVFVDVTSISGFASQTYGLLSFAGGTTLNGVNASNFVLRGQPGGYNYAFDLTGTNLNLIVSAIPEPSTYALLVGAATLGFVILRRRKPAAF